MLPFEPPRHQRHSGSDKTVPANLWKGSSNDDGITRGSDDASRIAIDRGLHFYHSMTIPGHGEVQGEWDLRGPREGVSREHRSCREEGSRDRHGERPSVLLDGEARCRGDRIRPLREPGMGHCPLPRLRLHRARVAQEEAHPKAEQLVVVRTTAGSAHGPASSTARSTTSRPSLGSFDVVTMGSILLHLRDPFLAMQKAASVARDTLRDHRSCHAVVRSGGGDRAGQGKDRPVHA